MVITRYCASCIQIVSTCAIYERTVSVKISRAKKAANAVITIAIRLRHDYDPTTMYRARLLPFDAIRREQKNEHVNISS